MTAPIFIPSKGRAGHCHTMRHLETIGRDYHVIVLAEEVDAYTEALGAHRVVELPQSYLDNYDLCHLDGVEYQSTWPGSGASRNYAWSLAEEQGARWHWVMDDNIQGFYVANRNSIVMADTSAWFEWMEWAVRCYANVAMAGPNYEMFVAASEAKAPLIINTRIYSCNLIRTDTPFRWRCQYNEDTILSLDMLAGGWCTLLFNQYVAKKIKTQLIGGGNTDTIYAKGTAEKSRMLYEQYPQVTRMVNRYGRDHHHVNYRAFDNKLKRLPPSKRPKNRPPDLRIIGPEDPEDQSPRAEALREWVNSGAGDAS